MQGPNMCQNEGRPKVTRYGESRPLQLSWCCCIGAMGLSRASQPSSTFTATSAMGDELALKCIRLNLVLMQPTGFCITTR